jgi:hypothetical protein
VAGTHDDVQTGLLRDATERVGLSPQPDAGDVDDGAAPRIAEGRGLLGREGFVVEQAVAAVIADEVDEQVFVGERDAKLRAGDRAGHGHDAIHLSALATWFSVDWGGNRWRSLLDAGRRRK